ncbi:MAG TPA: hypothetical protein VGK24_00280 [Candidatus Angelobacter sp.]|jgi:hypothetical protein
MGTPSGPLSALSSDAATPALSGNNDNGNSVIGTSKVGIGVWGGSQINTGTGGESVSGNGVHGISDSGTGVAGVSNTFRGVSGSSQTNAGVYGESQTFDGVFGVSNNLAAAGVSGHNKPGGLAGYFEGNVEVTGDVSVDGDLTLTGADFAEQFALANLEQCEPGTVMVMNENGAVTPSTSAYDRKVVGVISGAGEYKPALVIDRRTGGTRAVIALMGKVYCKVDACETPIHAGDLLTTSDRPGHGMKADGFERAFGAVIGKALQSLEKGCGMIPVLVNLQ